MQLVRIEDIGLFRWLGAGYSLGYNRGTPYLLVTIAMLYV